MSNSVVGRIPGSPGDAGLDGMTGASDIQRAFRDVFGNQRSHTHHGIVTDGDTFQDGDIFSDPDVVPDMDGFWCFDARTVIPSHQKGMSIRAPNVKPFGQKTVRTDGNGQGVPPVNDITSSQLRVFPDMDAIVTANDF